MSRPNEPRHTVIIRSRLFCFCLALIGLSFGSPCGAFATSASDGSQSTRNALALEDARGSIEKNRKGDVSIKVVDGNRRPVPSAPLRITQVSHAFKFGCYLKLDDLAPEKVAEYERQFSRLFNYAVIGTYWDFVEAERGKENWSWFNREAGLAQSHGMLIQAAPLLWGTNKYGTPGWLPKTRELLQRILEQHVRRSVTKSALVGDWEIVNEPLGPEGDRFAVIAGNDYVASAYRWARASAPDKRLVINESGVFGKVANRGRNSQTYFELINDLLKQHVPIDIIGIQAHAQGEWYEPASVAEQLEKYSALGKPIQITEFSAQTLDYDDRKTPLPIAGKYRTGIWNADKQAEFYREFYTVAFGNPHVEAIVTWGVDDERAWLPGIGLVAKDGTLKPVYNELERLITQEWWTRMDGLTDGDGVFRSRGFYGVYQIVVDTPKGTQSTNTFILKKGQPNEWVIRIGS